MAPCSLSRRNLSRIADRVARPANRIASATRSGPCSVRAFAIQGGRSIHTCYLARTLFLHHRPPAISRKAQVKLWREWPQSRRSDGHNPGERRLIERPLLNLRAAAPGGAPPRVVRMLPSARLDNRIELLGDTGVGGSPSVVSPARGEPGVHRKPLRIPRRRPRRAARRANRRSRVPRRVARASP